MLTRSELCAVGRFGEELSIEQGFGKVEQVVLGKTEVSRQLPDRSGAAGDPVDELLGEGIEWTGLGTGVEMVVQSPGEASGPVM